MQDDLGKMDFYQLVKVIVNKLIKKSESQSCNVVEAIVTSVNPLTVKINSSLELDEDFIKKINNMYLEVGEKVLVVKQRGGDMYYILGVIE